MKGPWKISVFVAKCIKTASFPCSLFNYPTLRTCPHQCLFIWNEYICAFWPCFQTKAIKSPNVVAYHARHVVRGKNENTDGAVDASAVWSTNVREKPGSRNISGDRRFWLAWNSSDCFESFSPLNNVWIDGPLMPSSDVTHYPKTG